MARIAAAATAAIFALAGCGGSADGKSGQGAAEAESREAELLQTAAEHMDRDDFDGALAILARAPRSAEVERRTTEFRTVAARETLRNARRQLAATRRRRESPRPAVSLSAVALRYHETPAARRFHERAKRALQAHKRRQAAR